MLSEKRMASLGLRFHAIWCAAIITECTLYGDADVVSVVASEKSYPMQALSDLFPLSL